MVSTFCACERSWGKASQCTQYIQLNCSQCQENKGGVAGKVRIVPLPSPYPSFLLLSNSPKHTSKVAFDFVGALGKDMIEGKAQVHHPVVFRQLAKNWVWLPTHLLYTSATWFKCQEGWQEFSVSEGWAGSTWHCPEWNSEHRAKQVTLDLLT